MRTIAISAAALLLAACGGKHPGSYQTVDAAQSTNSESNPALEAADALWPERVDEAKLKEALDKYEEALAADPANRHIHVRLTRGWYFWGDAFSDDTDTKVERWAKAIEYGTRCLALNKDIADRINGGEKEKDAVAAANKNDVPCLYWTATALGKWGKIQGLSKTLKHLPTVKAYMSKTEELDPQYYHYGPARYWGAYYAALPSFAGQDLDKSKEYFAASIQGAPYYLPTYALRAEYWAVPTQTLSQFNEDLDHVINADPNQNPDADVSPENIKEQEKAKKLLDKKAELFDKKVIEAEGGN